MDSCDDPVMKTALQTDDTVSFVFGLEVNWSLLQAKELSETRKKK